MKYFINPKTIKVIILICISLMLVLYLTPQTSSSDTRTSPTNASFMAVKDPSRYIKTVFSKLDVEKEILYKEVKNYKGELEKLYLDIYQPSDDNLTKRPAIVWIHGGGFSRGDKNGGIENMYAIEFARKGYVTVTINYRLRQYPSEDLEGTYKDALDDTASAVDWLVKNSEKYGVDKNHIAIGGHSAGAAIATQLTYKNEEHENWSKNSLFGVIDLSGFFTDADKPNEYGPPCVIIHGTNDENVPFYEAEIIAKSLEDKGVKYIYYPVIGAGHDLIPNFYEVLDVSTIFLYKALTNKDINIDIRAGTDATTNEILNARAYSNKKYRVKQIKFVPDGKLDEWGDSEVIQLDQLKDAGYELPPKEKFSGTAMLGWNENDPSRIYFSATIIDDSTEHNYSSDSSWWFNSCLELMFDMNKAGRYSPVIQLGFDADSKNIYASANDYNVIWKLAREGNKYIYEAALDLSKLGPSFSEDVLNYKASAGETLGLSLQYNKCKKGLREYQIGWTQGMTWDLRNFGSITFDPAKAK